MKLLNYLPKFFVSIKKNPYTLLIGVIFLAITKFTTYIFYIEVINKYLLANPWVITMLLTLYALIIFVLIVHIAMQKDELKETNIRLSEKEHLLEEKNKFKPLVNGLLEKDGNYYCPDGEILVSPTYIRKQDGKTITTYQCPKCKMPWEVINKMKIID